MSLTSFQIYYKTKKVELDWGYESVLVSQVRLGREVKLTPPAVVGKGCEVYA